MRGLLLAKASRDALEHEIADHLAGNAAGGGNPRHSLAITGVEYEGDTNALTVPAGDLEAVRRPAQVRADGDDLTVMGAAWRLAGIALQQEAVLRHHRVNAFVVEPGESGALTLSIEQCPDPTIAVRRPIIRQRSDGRQDLCILRLHSEPSSGNDGNREISFFHGRLSRLPGESRSQASSCPRLAPVHGSVSRGL